MASNHENLLAELRLTLRPGIRADADALRSLVGGILQSYGLPAPGAALDDDLADVAGWYGSRQGMFEVLEDSSGVLVGCSGAYGRSQTLCELRRLYLAYKVRHRGLGRVLLERVLAWARTHGFETIELFTAPVLKEAVQLYERYGFARQLQASAGKADACDLHFSLRLRDAGS
ncbi:MAG: GNAT family N-acetyltransferase [Gammaproteobacteria bacterium]|nr:GNAT family N-acetyltransferase [Gammaproteobacteria bacterium]MBU6508592.1 GNAT family N-acetyltransferase [Gammaproteobacteria bacterium]MDE1983079.1 GNAT family N-acetyltransferase [Gammaproteobacteria bacterium]MDE2107568.1 GNAT family N-acetyltransferase [Gammaproteobacteria bacterium]MDE2459865.1 GNAT family N-acetyltransferase [Gammaproteobacteria bacterium]